MGLAPDRSIVVYCESGKRSALACETLALMGFENVRSLRGGIEQWVRLGLPLLPGSGASGDAPEGAGSRGTASKVDLSDWDSIRNDFPITTTRIECTDGVHRELVYLDHAATTHPPSTALDGYTRFLGRGTPTSIGPPTPSPGPRPAAGVPTGPAPASSVATWTTVRSSPRTPPIPATSSPVLPPSAIR